jgi:hypothetical protein
LREIFSASDWREMRWLSCKMISATSFHETIAPFLHSGKCSTVWKAVSIPSFVIQHGLAWANSCSLHSFPKLINMPCMTNKNNESKSESRILSLKSAHTRLFGNGLS